MYKEFVRAFLAETFVEDGEEESEEKESEDKEQQEQELKAYIVFFNSTVSIGLFPGDTMGDRWSSNWHGVKCFAISWFACYSSSTSCKHKKYWPENGKQTEMINLNWRFD